MIIQVKAFQATKPELLTERVNDYLLNFRAPLVREVKYQVTWDENGLKYGALVVTEEQERPRKR